eukprot:TRINITY_DN1336_c0_g1_i1.p2 TRINITY_DN1336_c0_g1~~TRINITY_DN1336_c0_g1_i1.p2  ORF type:complete len:356 (-),score=84.89 TRINITY_DN1336_c0_g1_i1:10-1077(-)
MLISLYQCKIQRIKQLLLKSYFSLFYEQAITSGRDLQLLTEICIEDAIKKAEYYDELRRMNREKEIGILGGIPITLKDTYILKVYDSSLGCLSNCFKPYQEDGLLPKLIQQHGAIIMFKTNLSQCTMLPESGSFWGITCNPYNKERTSGGSSGGEAASISGKCSPFGFGGDIGGSLRIPALYCGLTSIKTTNKRITYSGSAFVNSRLGEKGNIFINAVNGPMTKTAKELEFILKLLINSEEMYSNDFSLPKQLWDEGISNSKKPLRLMYFLEDQYFPVCQTQKRAINLVVEKLRAQGHTLIEMNPYNMEKCVQLYASLVYCEGNLNAFKRQLDGCLLYTSPSPRDVEESRMPSSA